MTRTPRTSRSSGHRRQRRRRAVAVVTAGVTLALGVSSAADASARVASPDVASAAADAVAALERWQASGTIVDYADYVAARSRVASLVASGLGLPDGGLRTAWAGVRIEKQHAVLAAVSQVGVPYRSMKSEEGVGFDCSGLVLFAYGEAGIELPRSSGDQIREAEAIEGFDAEPGDLVHYPGHISMYVGMGLLVHSPYTGSEVEVRPMFDRSLRFGDVFDDDVVFVAPQPAATGAAAADRPFRLGWSGAVR
jgi:hypothetical protein